MIETYLNFFLLFTTLAGRKQRIKTRGDLFRNSYQYVNIQANRFDHLQEFLSLWRAKHEQYFHKPTHDDFIFQDPG
jgi:hypothetical protein